MTLRLYRQCKSGGDPRVGRPATAITEENFGRFHQMMMRESQLTINQLELLLEYSTERVDNILHN